MKLHYCFALFFCCWWCQPLFAQEPELAFVIGKITDEKDEALVGVNVILLIKGDQKGVVPTDEKGEYKIAIPANETVSLFFSYLGFQKEEIRNIRLKPNAVFKKNIILSEDATNITTVEVTPFENKEADAQVVTREDIQNIATTTMNLESMLQFMASGVSAGTGGELTSQYSVRGGNYDENLIYVNGFEVYRPLLIRNSQQEGLTFPNPDMLESLMFSSGGFKAQYGDKMSSVLDVKYRRPTRPVEVTLGGSLLGSSIYVGGAKHLDASRRLTGTLGVRYKTTRYLLNSQAIKGEYVPNFTDIQGNVIWDITKRIQLELLGNLSISKFNLVPKNGSNDTGLFNYTLNLYTEFQGQEVDDFTTSMSGASLAFASDKKIKEPKKGIRIETIARHRVLASYFLSNENERIDRLGEYWLTQKETDPNSDNFGKPIATLSYGMTHLFARNFLNINIINTEYRGAFNYDKYNDNTLVEQHHFLQWGIGYKNEIINDQLKEWTRYDSLYYTVPFDTTALLIPEYVKTNVQLNTHRIQGYVQNTWEYFTQKHQLRVTGGLRANYWSLNQELVISPRLQIYYTPRRYNNPMSDSTTKTKDLTFKICIGSYNQPPFYRELRNLQGVVNTNVLAQRSIHYLAGVVWDFTAWKRRFKFISEAYFKQQWNLVPYDVENVRIRYYGDNIAKGYVAGWDFRLNGELVKGLDSWVNLSFMRAREAFDSVQHKVRYINGATIDTALLKDVPKPTDQLFILSMYFQDNLPKAPWAQVNLALTVGAGMAFGVPKNNVEYRNTYRYSPYHRIDIGFSFALWNQQQFIKKKYENNRELFKTEDKSFIRRTLRSAWLSIEVFNLMQVANQSAYNWIKAFDGTSYGIPNTLTSRRINVRFRVEF